MKYKVADFRFSVQVPAGVDIVGMLPSFLSFRCEEEGDEIFHMEAHYASLPEDGNAELLEETVNDMGHCRLFRTEGGYCVALYRVWQGTHNAGRRQVHQFACGHRLDRPLCWNGADVHAPYCLFHGRGVSQGGVHTRFGGVPARQGLSLYGKERYGKEYPRILVERDI